MSFTPGSSAIGMVRVAGIGSPTAAFTGAAVAGSLVGPQPYTVDSGLIVPDPGYNGYAFASFPIGVASGPPNSIKLVNVPSGTPSSATDVTNLLAQMSGSPAGMLFANVDLFCQMRYLVNTPGSSSITYQTIYVVGYDGPNGTGGGEVFGTISLPIVNGMRQDPESNPNGDQSMMVWDVANQLVVEGWGWQIGPNTSTPPATHNTGDTWSSGDVYQNRTCGFIKSGTGYAPLLPHGAGTVYPSGFSGYTNQTGTGYNLGQTAHADPASHGLSSSGISYMWTDVTVEEVYNLGVIAHPLALACLCTGTIRQPAIYTDGSGGTHALDQGTVFQLTVSQATINGLTLPMDRMVAQAMHDYGFIVTDTSAAQPTILFENDNAWVTTTNSPWFDNSLVGSGNWPIGTTGAGSLQSLLTSGNLRSLAPYSL